MARVSIFLVIEIAPVIIVHRYGTRSVHRISVRISPECEVIDFSVTAVQ